ncbi:MAG: lipid-binding SYLF domain-containing protein [Gammaproteobacteria bacterium]|nr:lipid-binding SYLF domain-containing protein [Gammaproteobacteria bacterium]
MKIYGILAATSLAILGLGATTSSLAADKAEIDSNVTATLVEFDALVPSYRDLREKAAGVLVFPRVTKGGVGVAGEYGQGVLQVDGKTVGYYSIGSASVGLTLGLARHSEIIMFMTQDALDKFTSSDGWSIGADAGITVVSTGSSGEYDSKTQQKPVLAFAFAEKGLIGDLSLEGSKITRIMI